MDIFIFLDDKEKIFYYLPYHIWMESFINSYQAPCAEMPHCFDIWTVLCIVLNYNG